MYLRQSTASQSRVIGPFIDDTDFKTLETGLTIANTDVKLIQNGAASINKNSGGGTHRANGFYSFTFDATDTSAVGELEAVIGITGALVVKKTFFVLEESVYDALFASSAGGYSTADKLLAYMQLISRKDTAIATDRSTELAEINANEGSGVGTFNNESDSQEALRDAGASLADIGTLESTTIATLSSQTVFTLTSGSSDNDAYNGAKVIITDVTTEEQKAVGVVSDYVGSSKQITLKQDPGIFTMAVGDKISIIAPSHDIFYREVDGTITFEQSVRLANSTMGGKASGLNTTSASYRDLADTKDRIVSEVDIYGNRTSITRDLD